MHAPDLRYEVKFTAPEAYLPKLRAGLRLHPMAFRRLHPPRWINNLYLDSQDFTRLNQNYAGISERCKVRLRWYGETLSPVRGTVEFKLKRDQLGWKRHYPVAREFDLRSGNWSAFLVDLGRELPPEARVQMQNLTWPVLINRYHREYYATPDRLIRLTVDCRQKFYGQWDRMWPNLRFSTQPLELLVVEVKAPSHASARVRSAVQALPLLRSKNSKYVSGTERLLGLR
jgi:hypothetical protein